MDEYAYVVNVEGAVVRDDEYLLVERAADEDHAAGLLGFPGGKVEQAPGGDDTFEAAAARELREEVGVEVGSVEYVCSSTFEADGGTQCINVVTLCTDVSGEARAREPEEVAAIHWLSADEIGAHEDAPDYLESYVDRIETVRDGRA